MCIRDSNYVLSLEGNDWFDPRRIGELADTYVSNHTSTEKPVHVSIVYVTVNAGFSDACISPAACALSRDVVTGARKDGPTGVCIQSRRNGRCTGVC